MNTLPCEFKWAVSPPQQSSWTRKQYRVLPSPLSCSTSSSMSSCDSSTLLAFPIVGCAASGGALAPELRRATRTHPEFGVPFSIGKANFSDRFLIVQTPSSDQVLKTDFRSAGLICFDELHCFSHPLSHAVVVHHVVVIKYGPGTAQFSSTMSYVS